MRLTRKERIKLLLRTYRDAVSPGRNPSDSRGAFDSRPPAVTELWMTGSYHDLARALDAMRGPCPKVFRHTVGYYIDGEEWAQKRTAEKGVIFLDRLMPRNVYVPHEIAENAGFAPSEAKSARHPDRRVAA